MRWFCLWTLMILSHYGLNAQFSWDWKDPNDFNLVDLGDNKVILYNLLGTGIVHLLDRSKDSSHQVIDEFSLSYIGEYSREPLSDLFIAEVRRSLRFRKYLRIGGGLRYYWTETERDDSVHGIGVHAWFKWFIIKKDNFRLAYDNGVGPNYFFSAFPKGGTNLNFTTTYGFSFDIRLADQWLTFSFSNLHISNANIKGAERNKALDGIGIRIGIEY